MNEWESFGNATIMNASFAMNVLITTLPPTSKTIHPNGQLINLTGNPAHEADAVHVCDGRPARYGRATMLNQALKHGQKYSPCLCSTGYTFYFKIVLIQCINSDNVQL